MNRERALPAKQLDEPRPQGYLLFVRLRKTGRVVPTLKDLKLRDLVAKVSGHGGQSFGEKGAMALIPLRIVAVVVKVTD
jgi:hypothetical protein